MNFFPKLKSIIRTAATQAVFEAEKTFGSGAGLLKKQAAINFVVNALPVPGFLRGIISAVLSAFIDSSIEAAVTALQPDKPEN